MNGVDLIHLSIVVAYSICALTVLVYSLGQLNLLYHYYKFKNTDRNIPAPIPDKILPKVTVQLPIFNELFVAERLIRAVASLDYPTNKLEIQVLDDSTDETAEISKKLVEEFKQAGSDISWIHRKDRQGYKAGALQEGLKICKGEFIAIFDADFIPEPGFLKSVLPYFDDGIGMVQARWAHVNKDYSLLTQLQAFALDTHFSIEQNGRSHAGYFMNFNGTAGIWRKTCIEDAGAWKADTITEDLDLSYRAQLKGWKFKYVDDVEVPAELPAEINAVKTQQHRWNKGAAEVARMSLKNILFAPINARTKFHASLHLLGSSMYISIFGMAILSLPLLWVKHQGYAPAYFNWASVFLLSLGIFTAVYFTAFTRPGSRWQVSSVMRFMMAFPALMSLTMGLGLHNSLAVAGGWLGVKTGFIRTPKFGLANGDRSWKHGSSYLNLKLPALFLPELILAAYFAYAMSLCFVWNDFALFPFYLFLFLGYGMISLVTLLHARLTNR